MSTEVVRDEYYEAALKFCQEHGYEGDELPPFRPGRPSENCPVTVALDVEHSAYGWVHLKNGTTISGGDAISEFMVRADSGAYPQLGYPSMDWDD